jgi:hypothetical protein
MKEEALKLADDLQKHFNCYNEYSDMIRILVEHIEELENPIMQAIGMAFAKPLSDEEILALWVQKNKLNGARDIVDFARAILKKASEK